MKPSAKPNSSTMKPIKKVGRFTLFRELGRGAIGTIYFGHDPVIDRDVAIKLFHNVSSGQDKKQRDQIFMNEARAAGRLSHPNIVTIFDAEVDGNESFIAMEYLQGQDLRQFLNANKPLSNLAVAQLMQKVAEGIHYAHKAGVIHRDIKPANIFLLDNMQVKIVDFGIARAARPVTAEGGDQPPTLFNNNILGTPNYMSPEQAQAIPVTKLTDIYSLGVVMYELLVRQKPFQSRDMNALIDMIVNKRAKSPHEINPEIPATLSRIVTKAMSKRPEKRYQSAEEMAQALRRFILTEKRNNAQGDNGLKQGLDEKNDGESKGSYGRLFWLSCIAITIAAAIALHSWINKL